MILPCSLTCRNYGVCGHHTPPELECQPLASSGTGRKSSSIRTEAGHLQSICRFGGCPFPSHSLILSISSLCLCVRMYPHLLLPPAIPLSLLLMCYYTYLPDFFTEWGHTHNPLAVPTQRGTPAQEVDSGLVNPAPSGLCMGGMPAPAGKNSPCEFTKYPFCASLSVCVSVSLSLSLCRGPNSVLFSLFFMKGVHCS